VDKATPPEFSGESDDRATGSTEVPENQAQADRTDGSDKPGGIPANGKEIAKERAAEAEEDEESVKAELIEDAAEQAAEIVLEQFERSFSGPVMPADEFYKFLDEDRERVLRISEARTSDESRRLDRLVTMQERVTDAQIRMSGRTLWINAVFYGGSVVAVFASYALWQNLALSLIFLGPATVKMIGSSVVAAVRRRRDDDDPLDD
jgi:hypothetical protein